MSDTRKVQERIRWMYRQERKPPLRRNSCYHRGLPNSIWQGPTPDSLHCSQVRRVQQTTSPRPCRPTSESPVISQEVWDRDPSRNTRSETQENNGHASEYPSFKASEDNSGQWFQVNCYVSFIFFHLIPVCLGSRICLLIPFAYYSDIWYDTFLGCFVYVTICIIRYMILGISNRHYCFPMPVKMGASCV